MADSLYTPIGIQLGVTPPDAGSAVLTVTQGANSVTLGPNEGTTVALVDGVYVLSARLPFPYPNGITTDYIDGAGKTGAIGLSAVYGVGGAAQTPVAGSGTLFDPNASVFVTPADSYDPSVPLRVFQGDTRKSVAFYLPSDVSTQAVSATLALAPLVSAAPFLPDPVPAMQGQTLLTDGLTADTPYFRLRFPPSWTEADLPRGAWKARAVVLYASGEIDTVPLFAGPTMTQTAYLAVSGPYAFGAAQPSTGNGQILVNGVGNEPFTVGN